VPDVKRCPCLARQLESRVDSRNQTIIEQVERGLLGQDDGRSSALRHQTIVLFSVVRPRVIVYGKTVARLLSHKFDVRHTVLLPNKPGLRTRLR
jgi:hypothetical protein